MQAGLDEIAQRLSWQMDSWKSIKIHVNEEFKRENYVMREGIFESYSNKTIYIEDVLGKRLHEDRMTVHSPEKRDIFSAYYSDGELSANLRRDEHGQDWVTIKRTFGVEDGGVSCRPWPLNSFYVGLEPLSKVVPRAASLGTDRCINRNCDVLLFSKPNPALKPYECVIHLDQETSVPLKYARYEDSAARASQRPTYVWSAKSLDLFEGRHFPANSELVSYAHAPGTPGQVDFRSECRIESIQFNKDYPKTMFWPVITKQTNVMDTVKGGIKNSQTQPVASNISSTTPPIRAGQSRDFPVVGVFAGLGLALLIAAIIVRVRRG